jgi:hypothetical protein
MRLIVSVILGLFVQGCVAAVPASQYRLINEGAKYPPNRVFVNNISAVNVQVIEDARGAVKPEEVSLALKDALFKAGYLSSSAGKDSCALTATISKLDYPAVYFNLNLKATIKYEIRRLSDGKFLTSELVTIGHEVPFLDQSDSDERLRTAVAFAIGGNITHFLRKLSITLIES